MSADATFDEVLLLSFPLRLSSNAREHWRTAAARKKSERETVHYEWWAGRGRPLAAGETADVLLTRIGPRLMDAHDNLPNAFKQCVDQIAEELGLAKQDNSPRLTWKYAQRKGAPGEYSIVIQVRYSSERPPDFPHYHPPPAKDRACYCETPEQGPRPESEAK